MLVLRAVEDDQPIEALLYHGEFRAHEGAREAIAKLRRRGAVVREVSPSAMGRAVPGPRLPAAAALVPLSRPKLADLLRRAPQIIVVFDGVANPDNLGLALRTAEGAGADGVVFLEGCADPFSRRAVRGARGAVGRLPMAFASGGEALEQLKREGWQVIATSAHGPLLLTELDPRLPLAVVVGSESRGVHPELAAAAHCLARLPMYGRQSSHNVAVATGMILQALRMRVEEQRDHPKRARPRAE